MEHLADFTAKPEKPRNEELEYVGFWPRLWASIIDTILSLVILYPILFALYGREYFRSEHLIAGGGDFILTHILPAVAIIIFWIYRSATPGKMAIGARIVDARTGGHPSKGQLIGRYLAYYISMFPFFLGFLWIAWDPRKQGWHDKLAGTVVVRPRRRRTEKVTFDQGV